MLLTLSSRFMFCPGHAFLLPFLVPFLAGLKCPWLRKLLTSCPSPTLSLRNDCLWSLRPLKEWVNYFHQSVCFNDLLLDIPTDKIMVLCQRVQSDFSLTFSCALMYFILSENLYREPKTQDSRINFSTIYFQLFCCLKLQSRPKALIKRIPWHLWLELSWILVCYLSLWSIYHIQ